MCTQPIFSIIIPTFNRKLFLKKAVDSVLDQTYTNFELIIIDDGSTDDSKEIINAYYDARIKYSYQENNGVASARNHGLKKAKGKYVAFLDSDDWWVPEKLSKTMDYINKFPNVKIFHTEETWYKKGKLLNQKTKHKKPTGFVYTKSLPLCCISISTAVIKKDVFDNIELFDETFEACEDYDFWLRATNKYKIKLIPEYLTLKDGGREDQLSSSIWGLDRFRIKALGKMLDSNELNNENYNLTLKEFNKKCTIFAMGAEKRGRIEEAESYRKLAEKYV